MGESMNSGELVKAEAVAPSWASGQIRGKPLPFFASGVTALVTGIALVGHTLRLPVVTVLLFLLITGGPALLYIAYEKCRRATWDEEGVTLSFLGTFAERVAWRDVTALDKNCRLWSRKSGKVRMIGLLTSTVREAALLETAAIGYARLFQQAKIRLDVSSQKYDALVSTSKRTETLAKNDIWRRVAVDRAQPNVRQWELSPDPGIYVYKTHGSRTQVPILVIPAVLFSFFQRSIDHLVESAWQIALFEASIFVVVVTGVLVGFAIVQRAAKRGGVDTGDTVEVSNLGIRVWKQGKPTPWLQYPRKSVQRLLRWLPGGVYQLWSNGEEQHAIDPRFLVPLQADLPPEFAYAATEGGGWLTPEHKPIARNESPESLPEKGQ